ncbi:hypothetical protein LXL04_033800 [Taraxacum kok-saghyz]
MLGAGLQFGRSRGGEDRFYSPAKARRNRQNQKNLRIAQSDVTPAQSTTHSGREEPENRLIQSSKPVTLESSVAVVPASSPLFNLERFLESVTPSVPAQHPSKEAEEQATNSIGYGLMLSITQLAFQKILKSTSYKVVFDMTLCQNVVASVVILVGLFASGEWKDINGEMRGYQSGTVSYIANRVGTANCRMARIPITPVLALVFFDEKMNGVKVMSMLLAIWEFVSYIYQHYLDDLKEKANARLVNLDREINLTETTRVGQ